MSIQVEFRADFIPVGEASFLDSWYMADQILAILSDVVSEWEVNFLRDVNELWQHSKRNDIQLFMKWEKNISSIVQEENII